MGTSTLAVAAAPPAASTEALTSTAVAAVVEFAIFDSAVSTPTLISKNIATKLEKSSKRMHQVAQISEKRPEILAVLDFKPLYAAGGDLTLAGKMFDARIAERSQTLETIKTLLSELETNLPDEYSAALNQYSSSLASTKADMTLLKLMILLREYATHTARFLDFKDEYEPAEDMVDELQFWGTTTKQQIRKMLAIKSDNTLATGKFWNTATVPLVQMMSDISFCTYALIPDLMNKKKRVVNEKDGIGIKFQSYDRIELPVLNTAFCIRDMVASHEFVKLRIGDEVDDDFAALVGEVLDPAFVTSGIDQSWTAFKMLAGVDEWSRMRTSTDTEKAGLTSQSQSTVSSYIDNRHGVLSKLVTKQGREKILIPETTSATFGNTSYKNIDPIVDEAFSGDPPLNFEDFNQTIGDFTQALKDLSTFGKTLCRIGDKAEGAGYSSRGYTICGDDPPFSVGSAASVVLDVMQRRFLEVFYDCAYDGYCFEDYETPGHVMYNRMIAWKIFDLDWELAYGFVSAFIDDYEDGYLTAAAIPEEVEVDTDDDGNPIMELQDTAYVLPNTTTPATAPLAGGARLSSKLWNMPEWCSRLPHLTTSVQLDGGDNEKLWPNAAPGKQPWLEPEQFAIGTLRDLRPCNPIHSSRTDEAGTGATYERYLGSKIIAAEIIDSVLEILRFMLSPIEEPEAVEDGSPIWPSLADVRSPYGTRGGSWTYDHGMYASMGLPVWIPTVEKWYELFARSGSKNTYFRKSSLKSAVKNIVRALHALMRPFKSLRLRHTRKGLYLGTNVMKTDVIGFAVPDGSGWLRPQWSQFFKNMSAIVPNILDSSWSELPDLEPPYQDWESRTNSEYGGEGAYNELHDLLKEYMLDAHKNDVALEFLYNFIEGYANRIDNYNVAVQGLVEGEDSSLGIFVESVLDAGDDGVDLLQNITPIQLALKQIALNEEIGDEENAYLPTAAILNDSEISAIRHLFREPSALSPEGDTSKIVVVGMPAGMFDALGIDDEFAIRVSYVDVEYPQLVFHGKTFPFLKDVYITPTDLESGISDAMVYDDVVDDMSFTKLTVTVEESNDTSASITIADSEKTKKTSPSNANFTAYSNHAASDILKMYCRVMLGMNFAESAFLGTTEGIQIPINDYAADLAASMAAGLETIGEVSENLASSATDLLSDLSTLEEESFVSGEISPVDESLLTSLRDAFQTRLFSSEIMKSRVLSAKMFDRIFALVVDPDEFYIVTPDDTDASGVTTPQNVLDFYLNKGVIEETGESAPFRYRLAPRKTAEGRMAFGRFHITIVSTPTNQDRTLK